MINEFEDALRTAFLSGAHDQGVIFIQPDVSWRVRACAPNKVLLSDVVAVSESSMLLPTDFQTRGGSAMATIQNQLDKLIKDEWLDTGKFIEIGRKLRSLSSTPSQKTWSSTTSNSNGTPRGR